MPLVGLAPLPRLRHGLHTDHAPVGLLLAIVAVAPLAEIAATSITVAQPSVLDQNVTDIAAALMEVVTIAPVSRQTPYGAIPLGRFVMLEQLYVYGDLRDLEYLPRSIRRMKLALHGRSCLRPLCHPAWLPELTWLRVTIRLAEPLTADERHAIEWAAQTRGTTLIIVYDYSSVPPPWPCICVIRCERL